MTNSARSLGLPGALKEKMGMKVPTQAYRAEFPAQMLVLCPVACKMWCILWHVSLWPRRFCCPTVSSILSFSEPGYKSGYKAAMVEWTQPGVCHQEFWAQICAPHLTGWGMTGKPLAWSQPQCPHLYKNHLWVILQHVLRCKRSTELLNFSLNWFFFLNR